MGGAAFLLILGFLISIALGFGVVIAAYSIASRREPARRQRIRTIGLLIAVLANLWWVALASLLIWKFYVLGEDT